MGVMKFHKRLLDLELRLEPERMGLWCPGWDGTAEELLDYVNNDERECLGEFHEMQFFYPGFGNQIPHHEGVVFLGDDLHVIRREEVKR